MKKTAKKLRFCAKVKSIVNNLPHIDTSCTTSSRDVAERTILLQTYYDGGNSAAEFGLALLCPELGACAL